MIVASFKLASFKLGWSGGAMVLSKLPVHLLLIWIIVGQGPAVLTVGAGGVV